jgi:hypothetical protein
MRPSSAVPRAQHVFSAPRTYLLACTPFILCSSRAPTRSPKPWGGPGRSCSSINAREAGASYTIFSRDLPAAISGRRLGGHNLKHRATNPKSIIKRVCDCKLQPRTSDNVRLTACGGAATCDERRSDRPFELAAKSELNRMYIWSTAATGTHLANGMVASDAIS